MSDSGKKTEYDLVVPLGAACAASLAPRAANLQFSSYPFDWVGGGDVVGHARLVAEDFREWFRMEDLELTDVVNAIFNSSVYRNRVTGLVYSHDFPAGCYLEDEYPKVAQKYERRIRRLYADMAKAKRVLAVYNEIPYRPVAPDADLLEAQRLLQGRFPEIRVDLVYFAQAPDCIDREPVNLTENVTKIVVDYHTMSRGYVSVSANYYKMFLYLRDHCHVKDVRTPEQVAKRDAAERARKAGRWGVGFDRWLNRKVFHLYRHLERWLADRGCIPDMERPLKLYKERGERRRSPGEPDISSLPRDEAAAAHAYDLL